MGNPLSDRPIDDPAILALRKPAGASVNRYLDHEADAACRRADLGPATSADLAELDAVPEPVDSDAPAETHAPGCAPIGPTAKTRPYRVPTASTYQDAQRRWLDEHGPDAVRCLCRETGSARGQTCPVHDLGLQPNDIHARTLARART